MALVVQKYGGSSVVDAERIMNVARRIAETRAGDNDVVVVVSAMGDTTDGLIELARQVNAQPEERELDVLLSTGEVVSSTLLAMALHSLDYKAVSLNGVQAGIETDASYSRARFFGSSPGASLKNWKKVILSLWQGFRVCRRIWILPPWGVVAQILLL